MANSYLAGVKAILDAAFLNDPPKGISPPPLKPDAEFPWIILKQIGGSEIESLDGLSNLTPTNIQVEVWSPDYEEAFDWRNRVLAALEPFSGAAGTTGLTVDACTLFTYRELYDDALELHDLILRCSIFWIS